MFEAAVSKFTESVGSESNMVPVPDLDTAFHCEPKKVVIKKNKYWFWQSPSYSPAKNVSLNELLTDTAPFEKAQEESHPMLTYNKTHKFSVKGKVGAKLKLVLGVEAQGSDYVSVEANLGDIVKVEVDRFELMKDLEARCVELARYLYSM